MQQIDQQTGEVVEGFVAYVVPKRKNGFQKGWMAMAQDAMMMLAQSNLTGNDMKVMWAMLARLDYENLIQVNQGRGCRRNRHEPPPRKPFNQEADRARRGLRGR